MRTSESPAEVIRRVALQEGVDPNTLLSIWQQESSGSTALGQRGQTLKSGHYARLYELQFKDQEKSGIAEP